MLSWRGGIQHPQGRTWPQASPLGTLWGHPTCVPPLVWHGIWSAGAGRSVPEDGGSVGFGRGHRPRPPHPLTTIASAHIAASHSHPYLERETPTPPETRSPRGPCAPSITSLQGRGARPCPCPCASIQHRGLGPLAPQGPARRLQQGPEFGHQSSALVCRCPCEDSSGPPAAAPGRQARTGTPPPHRGPTSGGVKLPAWLRPVQRAAPLTILHS